MDRKQLIDDLTLALVYLTSWPEKSWDGEVLRAWKGYSFDALDRLADAGVIAFSYKAKSLYLTKEGVDIAEEMAESFGRTADSLPQITDLAPKDDNDEKTERDGR